MQRLLEAEISASQTSTQVLEYAEAHEAACSIQHTDHFLEGGVER